MAKPTRYSPEVRERTVRLVLEQCENHGSKWDTIVSIAAKVGYSAETLRRWVRQYQTDHGTRAGVTTEDKARLRELEREVYVLRRSNEILRKAAAFFAQAELDRPSKR